MVSMTFCRAVLFDEKKEVPAPRNKFGASSGGHDSG